MAMQFTALVKKFARDDRGASMVEYALLLGIIATAAITALVTMGDTITTIFSNTSAKLTGSIKP